MIKKRFINENTSDMFIHEYKKHNLPTMSSCDKMMESFSSALSELMNSIAPMKNKEIKGKPKAPWQNGETVRMMKRSCRKAERKWLKHRLQIPYEIYKSTLSCYNAEMKQSRQQHI